MANFFCFELISVSVCFTLIKQQKARTQSNFRTSCVVTLEAGRKLGCSRVPSAQVLWFRIRHHNSSICFSPFVLKMMCVLEAPSIKKSESFGRC